MTFNHLREASVAKKKRNRISDEIRKSIINSLETNVLSMKTAATAFNLPYQTIVGIYKEFLTTGKVSRKKQEVFKEKKLDERGIAYIHEELDRNATLTLKELQTLIEIRLSIRVCTSTIDNYIKSFHYSFKRVQKIAHSIITPENLQQRKEHSIWFLRQYNSGRLIIYLDEVGFQVSMRRHYGRSKKGIRAQKVVKSIKTRNISVIAGMTSTSLYYYKVLETPGNSVNFVEYINDLLGYLLIGNIHNAILVLDNCSIHRSTQVKEMVENSGHELKFLPPYCPFFNPIENMFSQWKNLVGKKDPTSEDQLFDYIHQFQHILTSDLCKNYVDHVYHNCLDCLQGKNVYDA